MPAPTVPFVPPTITNSLGVPPLFGGSFAALPNLLPTASSGLVGQKRWGIFDSSNNSILTVDAVDSVEYARDYRISDYPQEEGKFMSYNKVQVPYNGKVGFLVGPHREAFLNQIEAQVASLQFVSLVTPEKTYVNANLTHYGYRRVARRGTTLILVEVWVEEVRITGQTQTSNAQGTNGQPTADGGQPQATDTTAQPINNISGLPNQNAVPPSDPASLANPAPSIGPAFYDSFNFPLVPNDAATLTGPQQGAAFGALNQASFSGDVLGQDGTGTGTLVVTPEPKPISLTNSIMGEPGAPGLSVITAAGPSPIR